MPRVKLYDPQAEGDEVLAREYDFDTVPGVGDEVCLLVGSSGLQVYEVVKRHFQSKVEGEALPVLLDVRRVNPPFDATAMIG